MAPFRSESPPDATRALWASTVAFAVCFAVWTIFSIIGLNAKETLRLSETQFGFLIGTPILSGSLARVLFGALADQHGGRRIFALVMVLSALATFTLTWADSYGGLLLAGLGIGLAGGSYPVGISYISSLFPKHRQSAALAVFGLGNAGAALTGVSASLLAISAGWQVTAQFWSGVLLLAALAFLLLTRGMTGRARGNDTSGTRLIREHLSVLRRFQVWRFSLYYFFVFGAFLSLVLWLPHYLINVYGLGIGAAGILAALFSLAAGFFRFYGDRVAERYGARAILYWSFAISALCAFMLSYPPTDYTIHGVHGPISFSTSMGLIPFVMTVIVLGIFMGLGNAAVAKHIPVYYPEQIGTVSGVVGMVGGLGGFLLPIAFGILADLTGVWTSSFAILFLLAGASLVWMHLAIRHMETAGTAGAVAARPELAEMAPIHDAALHAPGPVPAGLPAGRARVLADWRPEDEEFWTTIGRPIARRNLWISTYCLLISFAVWMVWSVVVARLPSVGFDFTTDQLFWLAALPGVSGATLRIFYAFLVPVFGGRLWTTMSTASLLVPAFGIGYAVQNPDTPYLIFLVLSLLCGFGGGNFASSVANISFFFPKAEKGNALAINSGLGNLGVSLMQLIVPVAITISLFGALGGPAQLADDGAQLWMQNAGFIWVPLIIIGVFASWFGMNDILSAKSSFSDQAAIFGRIHTWLLGWLYTGSFGTFIGMSAGFPLLTALVFPEQNALRLAFIGPLVGALSRAGSGWIADRLGGAMVTFWMFVVMMAAVAGMLWFLGGGHFWGFYAMVLVLFLASGVASAATFQMVPGVIRAVFDRTEPNRPEAERRVQADREAAAIIGFISAIAAYGAFYIPKAYGTSIELTGAPDAAIWGFLLFYISCAAMLLTVYRGPSGTPQSHADPESGRAGALLHASKARSL